VSLKSWRRDRREETLFQRTKARTDSMAESEAVHQIDLALMAAGQAISRYRHSPDRESQLDQLHEVRFDLEVSLGILDPLIPD
jgi:hypothetical protein